MQKVFEYIIEKLKERTSFLSDCTKYGNKDAAQQCWIPCSERLPKEKENPFTGDYMRYPVMVNIDGHVDLRYYFYGDGHWRYGYHIVDEYVTHWMDIEPYQPKGE